MGFPDSITLNRIDHVLMTKRCESSILDVKSYLGGNCNSDRKNYLIAKEYKAKLKEWLDPILRDLTGKRDNLVWPKTPIKTTREELVERESRRQRKDWLDNECQNWSA